MVSATGMTGMTASRPATSASIIFARETPPAGANGRRVVDQHELRPASTHPDRGAPTHRGMPSGNDPHPSGITPTTPGSSARPYGDNHDLADPVHLTTVRRDSVRSLIARTRTSA